jgi:hypothetical protein
MTNTVQQIAFARALKTLDAIGAQYAVIYNDETYGALKLAPPGRERKDGLPQYKYGETYAYYWPIMQHMQPGDVVKVPFGPFHPTVLSSNISAHCSRTWGSGNYVTKRDMDAQNVDILRIA